MESNQALFARIINDPEFGAYLKGLIMEKVYRKQQESAPEGILPPGSGPRGGEIRAFETGIQGGLTRSTPPCPSVEPSFSDPR